MLPECARAYVSAEHAVSPSFYVVREQSSDEYEVQYEHPLLR